MTPSSATGLDEKALEAALAMPLVGQFWPGETAMESEDSNWLYYKRQRFEQIIRAYMSALTVTSFPPAEQHDVTSHAVPHDGEGAVAWRGQNYANDARRLIEKALAEGTKVLGGPEGDTVLGYTLPNGLWLMLQANVRNLLDSLPPPAPKASEAGQVEEVARLILSVSSVSYDEANTERRKMARAAAEKVIALFTHPAPVAAQPAEGWVTVPREPTEAMVEAGIDALREHTELLAIARDPLFVWRYMLSALPAPVAAQPADDVQALLETLDGGVQATGGQSEDGTELFHVEDASEAMVDAARLIRKLLASSPTPPTALAVPAGVTVTELRMTPFADSAPVRDEANGEQTILTYCDPVGTWDIAFFESGWEFPDKWLGATHWLDITDMWPGVIAQVAGFSALPAQPNNSERQKALDAAAALVDGWTTATNTRHLQGWGVHTNAVADMLAKRDAEIATAIRALATNPPNSSEGEPT